MFNCKTKDMGYCDSCDKFEEIPLPSGRLKWEK